MELNAEILRQFETFQNYSDEHCDDVLHQLELHKIPKGALIARSGEDDQRTLFLLKGTLLLVAKDKRTLKISSENGSASAYRPIADLRPRLYDVYAAENTILFCLKDHVLKTINAQIIPDESSEIITSEDVTLEGLIGFQIYEDIQQKKVELPSLPDIAIKIGKVMRQDDYSTQTIAEIIQSDPSITAKIIRTANSVFYKGNAEISSAHDAIVRIGMKEIHNLVQAFAVKELFHSEHPAIKKQMQQVWEHSVKVASIAFILAREIKGLEPEHAKLGGLTHDIGSIAILRYIESHYHLLRDESEIADITNNLRAEFGGMILNLWGFPQDLVDVAHECENWTRDHDKTADYTDVVIIAQIHSLLGTKEMRGIPPMTDLPAFDKLGLKEMGMEGGLKILEDAKEHLQEAQAL